MPFSSTTTWTSLSLENNSAKPRQPKSFRSLSWFIQFLLQNHIETCDFNTHSTWTWIFSLGIFIKASETELRRRDTDRFTLDHSITDCREKSTLDKKFKQLREYGNDGYSSFELELSISVLLLLSSCAIQWLSTPTGCPYSHC